MPRCLRDYLIMERWAGSPWRQDGRSVRGRDQKKTDLIGKLSLPRCVLDMSSVQAPVGTTGS
jgi:hypothetical protein